MADSAKVLWYVFLLLLDNHDLGVTDPLPSVCESLTMAMVHIFAREILNFGILYLWLYYQPVNHELARKFLVDHSRREIGHPWHKSSRTSTLCMFSFHAMYVKRGHFRNWLT